MLRSFFILLSVLILGCSASSTRTDNTSSTPVVQSDAAASENDNSVENTNPVASAADDLNQAELSAESWLIQYDGYGSIQFDEGGILMVPKSATDPEETHAALIFLRDTIDRPLKNFELHVVAQTIEQLRSGAPNPWEVFWIFFNYNSAPEGKTTNYFIFKPNGLELGRAFDETGQYFLNFSSPATQTMSLGQTYTYRLVKVDGQLSVWIDDVLVLEFSSTNFPDAIYDEAGSIGFYTEDAAVRVQSVEWRSYD